MFSAILQIYIEKTKYIYQIRYYVYLKPRQYTPIPLWVPCLILYSINNFVQRQGKYLKLKTSIINIRTEMYKLKKKTSHSVFLTKLLFVIHKYSTFILFLRNRRNNKVLFKHYNNILDKCLNNSDMNQEGIFLETKVSSLFVFLFELKLNIRNIVTSDHR